MSLGHSNVTGIVVKYTKYVFRAPQVTGIVVKYTKWLELSLNTPSMSLRHYVFTAPKYVFTALYHADPDIVSGSVWDYQIRRSYAQISRNQAHFTFAATPGSKYTI